MERRENDRFEGACFELHAIHEIEVLYGRKVGPPHAEFAAGKKGVVWVVLITVILDSDGGDRGKGGEDCGAHIAIDQVNRSKQRSVMVEREGVIGNEYVQVNVSLPAKFDKASLEGRSR